MCNIASFKIKIKTMRISFGSFSRALLKNISLISPPIPALFVFFNFLIVKSDCFLVIPLEDLHLTFYLQEIVTCQWLLHCKFSYYSMFSHASVAIWPSGISLLEQLIFTFSEKSFQLLQMRYQNWACYLQVVLYYYSKVPKHGLLLLHIILYSFSLWFNFHFSCLSDGLKDFPLTL